MKTDVKLHRNTAKRWNNHSFAHRMIANLQVEMAQEVYEIKATKDNDFYKEWPDRSKFVRQVAPLLRDEARKILTDLLTRDDVSEHDKNDIYEALVLDASIPNEDRIHLNGTMH